MKNVVQSAGMKYPLHPLLAHFPIALFVLSFLLDILAVTFGHESFVRGAFYSMVLGVATALVAAIPGFIDFLGIRQDHPAKRTASWHMALNLAAVAIYAVNIGMRYPQLAGENTSSAPLGLSILGILLISISGYLGGIMVYDDGVAVGRHRRKTETPRRTVTAPAEKAGAFVPVADQNAIGEGETLRVELNGQIICVAKTEGHFHAFQEFCTHRYGPLSEGALCQHHIICPWHRSEFDIRTGKVIHGPAKVDLKTFRVELRDGQICVAVQPNFIGPAEQRRMAA